MTVDTGPRPDAGTARAHVLQVADTDHAQHVGAAAWVDRELAFGAKVFYKGWLGDDGRVEKHWIAGPEGTRRTREALRSGQLEFLDFPTLIERCGADGDGLTAGLHRVQAEELRRALSEGWPSVAMTQESPRRQLADDAEVAEFARQEGGYDTLAADAPLRVLCQLNTSVENEVHVFESLGVHHRHVVDVGWEAVLDDGRWRLHGDLDAHVARRFGGALAGALREKATGGDLHIDLARVGFVDVACAQLLVLAARAEPECRRIVLHDPPRLLNRLLDVLQRPASIVVEDGGPAVTTDLGAATAGLLHAAVLCGDPEELARRVAPDVRTVLGGGGTAEIVLDRRGVRAFRDAVGEHGHLCFPSPATAAATAPAQRVQALAGARDARGLVLGRVCADDRGPEGELAEDAITLLLADVPVSVLCVYDPGDPDELARALRSHPWLHTPDGPRRNPDFRPPSASSPVPAGLLGASVATLPVTDGAALSTLRGRVAAIARDLGLDPERAAAVVLAAHEAMLLASGADLRSDLLPGRHVLDVRVTAAAVVAECRGTPPSGTPTPAVEDPRFAHLRRFCDHATAHTDQDGRLVRVLTGTAP